MSKYFINFYLILFNYYFCINILIFFKIFSKFAKFVIAAVNNEILQK